MKRVVQSIRSETALQITRNSVTKSSLLGIFGGRPILHKTRIVVWVEAETLTREGKQSEHRSEDWSGKHDILV
jgi:uncharacterized protein (DUF433 family)